MSQSTNDVYPTALRLTLIRMLDTLVEQMGGLQRTLVAKGVEFADVIKMGRTQLQDAVPMTMGQEFDAYAVMVGEDIQRVIEAQALIHEINMGATAIGTGLNAPPGYTRIITEKLRRLTGVQVIESQTW